MKKTLIIAIPVGLLLIFIAIHSASAYGFRRQNFGKRGDFLFYRLDRLSEKLNFTSAQKADLERLKKDLQAMMDERDAQRLRFRRILREELSKDQLNTSAITEMLNAQIDNRAHFRHQIVNRIGEFLGRLTPEQRKELSERILDRFQVRDQD